MHNFMRMVHSKRLIRYIVIAVHFYCFCFRLLDSLDPHFFLLLFAIASSFSVALFVRCFLFDFVIFDAWERALARDTHIGREDIVFLYALQTKMRVQYISCYRIVCQFA